MKRPAVVHLQARMGMSERRTCQIVGADRKMIRYCSVQPPETELRQRLRDLANERRRIGYRRLFGLLCREGELSSINRIYRLSREHVSDSVFESRQPGQEGSPIDVACRAVSPASRAV